ncbi:hypothetical protein [Kineosporia sp. NBRC 101677]|uniref:hypothetical protein n=1 Tax=Kineosporia sp. NBRC 101677 TaxID=3032197 RepID=UPI00255452B2|nr:hypothetical protein [Kineosporia sp. NBRC 101677]
MVAELHVTQMDMPWIRARVERLAGFEAFAPLYAEDIRLLETLEEEAAEWSAHYDLIEGATQLLYPDGTEVPEYLLHIDGDEARWRRHHEPFQEH